MVAPHTLKARIALVLPVEALQSQRRDVSAHEPGEHRAYVAGAAVEHIQHP